MKLRKLHRPPHEEIAAMAMLLGDMPPMLCSCCRGNGFNSRLWGARECTQCQGVGYDLLGEKTRKGLREVMEKMNGL